MPHSNCDPSSRLVSRELEDEQCPKCGTEMEPIDVVAEGPPLRHVQLCPACYLVTWNDETGFQSRQGVPMKKGFTH
jgi:hypothetical protein